ASGATPANYKRKYYFYEGDLPFNSVNWTPIALTAGGTTATLHTLDDVVYFPNNVANVTPETFDDTLNCTAGSSCTVGTTDGKPDVIFFPDGRAQVPAGATVGYITLATDMRIPTKKYFIEISHSGR